jgi:glutamyl-tRNA reductase
MALLVVGLNHKTAPVAIRERLAFADQTLVAPLTQWHDPAVEEVVILSTCNRVECYLQGPDAEAGARCCIDFLAASHGLPEAQFVPHLYQWHDIEAVRHLFRVASSLDSLVLGEPQILGQVKAAYGAARAAQRTGVVLTPLFERALHVAKLVRSATGVSGHAVSVSAAAVELAKKIFEHLPEHTVMVLGAGETSELAARHLIRQGVTRLNRLGHPRKTKWNVRIMERYRHGAEGVTYLARYLRGGPIQNARLVAFDGARVTFLHRTR